MKSILATAYGHLRHVYHSARGLPDRIRHDSRYESALGRLAAMDRPRTILVVCHGNICRSPYLEAVLKRDLGDIQIKSAGFVGPGRPVPGNSLAVSARRGLDLTSFRSSILHPRRLRNVDLILVMDPAQGRRLADYFGVRPGRIVVVGDLDPECSSSRAIRDPWQQSIEVFESSFDRLDRCAATLTRVLRAAAPEKARPDSHSARSGERAPHDRGLGRNPLAPHHMTQIANAIASVDKTLRPRQIG